MMAEQTACTKVVYRSRIWAQRAVNEHKSEAGVCKGCRRGGRIQAYHCDATKPGHWHIGHNWPKRNVLASVEVLVGFILGAMLVGAAIRTLL